MKIIKKIILGLMVGSLVLASMALPATATANSSEVDSPIKNEQDLINHLLSNKNIAQIALTAANKQNSLENNSEARCDVKLTATVLPYITRNALDYSADPEYPVETFQEEHLANDMMTFEKTLVSNADSYKTTFNIETINDLFAEAQSGIFVHYNKYSLDFDKGEKMVYVLVLNVQTGYYQELPNNKTIDFGCYENFALYLGVANINSQDPFATPTPRPSVTRPPVTPPLPTEVPPTKAPPTNPAAPEPIPEIYIDASINPSVPVGTVGTKFSSTITYKIERTGLVADDYMYIFGDIDESHVPMEGLPPGVKITKVTVGPLSSDLVSVTIEGMPAAGDYTIMLPTGILVEKVKSDEWFGSTGSYDYVSIVARVFYPRTLTFPVKIAKGDGAVVSNLTASSTHDSIIVGAELTPNLGDQDIEYSLTNVNVAPDEDESWQSSPEFEGLDADTTYYVWARAAENMDWNEGIAEGVEVKTLLPTEPSPSPTPIPKYELKLSAIIASCMKITDSPRTYQMISNNPFTDPEDFWSNYALRDSGIVPSNSEQVTVSGGKLATYDAFPFPGNYNSATEMTNIWWQKTLLEGKPSSNGDWDTNILSKYVTFNGRGLLESIMDMVKATGGDPMNSLPTTTGPPENTQPSTTQPPTGDVSPTPSTDDGDGGDVGDEKPTPTPTVALTDPTQTPALPSSNNPLSSGGNRLSALENPSLGASTLGGSLVSAASRMFDPTQAGNIFLGGVSAGFKLGNIFVFAGIAAGVFAILAMFIVRRFAPKGDNAFVK